VGSQANKLGKGFAKFGTNVCHLSWQPWEGKGLDDAIAKSGEGWYNDVLLKATPQADYQKACKIPACLAAIARKKVLPMAPWRSTTGDFLPPLPPIEVGEIMVVQSATGSGKTTQIKAMVADAIAKGWKVLFLYNLNSLGQQTATDCGLPHIHDRNVYELSEAAGGMVMCFDSLHKLPDTYLTQPLLLILDEVNQDLAHLTEGDTLGDRMGEILRKFAQLARNAAESGAIILAEAVVFPHSVEFMQTVSGAKVVRRIDHTRIADRGIVQVSQTGMASGLLAEAVRAMERQEKIIWMSTSQRSTRITEEACIFMGLRAVRIDGETNREGQYKLFFDNPDQWLSEHGEALDCLILSPSCKTGVSITWPGFDRIFGNFPALGPDDALQMLARLRHPVPRHVLIPAQILTTGDEAIGRSDQIQKKLTQDRAVSMRLLGMTHSIITTEDEGEAVAFASSVAYHRESSSLRGTQKSVAHDYLVEALKADGFCVELIERKSDSDMGKLLTMCKEKTWKDDAAQFAAAVPMESVAKAKKTLSSECSLEDEFRAKKTLAKEKFPKVDFDNAATVYRAFYAQYGKLASGVNLHIDAENQEWVAWEVADATEKALRLGLDHKLPKRQQKALMIAKSGLLELVAKEMSLEWCNESPDLLQIREFCLKYRNDLRHLFGFHFAEEYTDAKGAAAHTPIIVVSKLLKAIGLHFVETGRTGTAKGRTYRYTIAPIVEGGSRNPEGQAEAWVVRQELMAAAKERIRLLQEEKMGDRLQKAEEKKLAAAAEKEKSWKPKRKARVNFSSAGKLLIGPILDMPDDCEDYYRIQDEATGQVHRVYIYEHSFQLSPAD
jgi:hypothetical protein